jgi:Flp pilus assembly protein TadG
MANITSLFIYKRLARGAAMIEFALVLPILLMLLIGIMEAGAMLYDKAVITNAAREGARVGILRRESSESVESIVKQRVNEYCSKKLLSFAPGSSSTEVVISVLPEASEGREFGLLSVSVSYTYKGFLLGSLLSAFSEPITLSSKAVMRYE